MNPAFTDRSAMDRLEDLGVLEGPTPGSLDFSVITKLESFTARRPYCLRLQAEARDLVCGLGRHGPMMENGSSRSSGNPDRFVFQSHPWKKDLVLQKRDKSVSLLLDGFLWNQHKHILKSRNKLSNFKIFHRFRL